MPICAYCKEERKVTREHVIPSFIYDFQKSLDKSIIGWNEVAEQSLPSEAKIKDVCGECNNIHLGKLDDEGKRLLTAAGVLKQNYCDDAIVLKYDFDKLMRWLLNISFNSTRSDGAHSHIFEPHIEYMLYGTKRVQRFQIALLACFAAPVELTPDEQVQEQYIKITGGQNIINPFIVRISYGHSPNGSNYTVRIVTFGALVFYLLAFDRGVLPGHAAVAIRKFVKDYPGTIEVKRQHKLLRLTPGMHSWLDMQRYQFNRIRNKSHVDSLFVKNRSYKGP